MAAALSPALKAAFEAASLPGDGASPPRALHVVPQARGALELEAQLPPAAGKTDREEWDATLKQVSVAEQRQRMGVCVMSNGGSPSDASRLCSSRSSVVWLHLSLTASRTCTSLCILDGH